MPYVKPKQERIPVEKMWKEMQIADRRQGLRKEYGCVPHSE